MSSKPTHRAHVVTQSKEGSDQKSYWHDVGVIFPHSKGKGFDLVVYEGISVSGRVVCTEIKTDDKQ